MLHKNLSYTNQSKDFIYKFIIKCFKELLKMSSRLECSILLKREKITSNSMEPDPLIGYGLSISIIFIY